uniref:Uncharacterized protein n=1 Tax=Branchiostoma floridae TaxID=7739 RepID=C3YF59_BRAFL|eukprot:XP_002605051.1 hypothetical protein BRAFLDRAFT_85197 [Branchiostoma floridae]
MTWRRTVERDFGRDGMHMGGGAESSRQENLEDNDGPPQRRRDFWKRFAGFEVMFVLSSRVGSFGSARGNVSSQIRGASSLPHPVGSSGYLSNSSAYLSNSARVRHLKALRTCPTPHVRGISRLCVPVQLRRIQDVRRRLVLSLRHTCVTNASLRPVEKSGVRSGGFHKFPR